MIVVYYQRCQRTFAGPHPGHWPRVGHVHWVTGVWGCGQPVPRIRFSPARFAS
jgi:hypothetical protein